MAKVRNPLPQTLAWSGSRRREVFLDHLVKQRGWQVGVEVGVRFGRVLFHLLENNPKLLMYAVDIDIGQFYNPKVQRQYSDRLIVLEGNSWDQAARISQSVDFVFIDASHSQKSVVKDIMAYRPLLRTPQGLLGHDVDFPAVQAALAQCDVKFEVGPDNVWVCL